MIDEPWGLIAFLASLHFMICWRALKSLIKVWSDHRVGLKEDPSGFVPPL